MSKIHVTMTLWSKMLKYETKIKLHTTLFAFIPSKIAWTMKLVPSNDQGVNTIRMKHWNQNDMGMVFIIMMW